MGDMQMYDSIYETKRTHKERASVAFRCYEDATQRDTNRS